MDETVYKRSPAGKEIAHSGEKNTFRLRFGAQSIDMSKTILIGRDKENDVVLSNDPLVSRRHAIIEIVEGKCTLKDLGSTNQTYLNNKPLLPKTEVSVKIGDIIMIGHTQLQIFRA